MVDETFTTTARLFHEPAHLWYLTARDGNNGLLALRVTPNALFGTFTQNEYRGLDILLEEGIGRRAISRLLHLRRHYKLPVIPKEL